MWSVPRELSALMLLALLAVLGGGRAAPSDFILAKVEDGDGNVVAGDFTIVPP